MVCRSQELGLAPQLESPDFRKTRGGPNCGESGYRKIKLKCRSRRGWCQTKTPPDHESPTALSFHFNWGRLPGHPQAGRGAVENQAAGVVDERLALELVGCVVELIGGQSQPINDEHVVAGPHAAAR